MTEPKPQYKYNTQQTPNDMLTASERLLLTIVRAGIFAASAQGLDVRPQWAVGLQGDTVDAARFAAGIVKALVTRAEAERAALDDTPPVADFWQETATPLPAGDWEEGHGR